MHEELPAKKQPLSAMSKESLKQKDTESISTKRSAGTITSIQPTPAGERIRPPLNRYAHMHGTLSVSLILTTLVSLGMFVFSILVRHFAVEFVCYIFEDSIYEILEENKKATNSTWAAEHFPYVLEKNDWGFDARDSKAKYIGRWARLFTDLGLTNVMLLWASSIAGLMCFFHKADAVVASFIILNMVSMSGIILTALALTIPSTSLSRGIEQDMVGVIQRDYRFYSGNLISRLMNTVMIVGMCCGISGPQDFGIRTIQSQGHPNSLVRNVTRGTHTHDDDDHDHDDDHDDDDHHLERTQRLERGHHDHHHLFEEIPLACCHRDSWRFLDEAQDQVICVGMGISHNNDKLFRNGCYSTYASMFVEDIGPYIFGITILVCIEQIIQMFVGIVILRWSTFVDHQTIIEKGVLISKSKITRYTLTSAPQKQT